MRRILIVLVLACSLLVLSSPARAVDWTLLAGYWDTDQAGESFGIGFRAGFPMIALLDFEAGVSWYPGSDNELDLGRVGIPEIPSLDTTFSVDTFPIDLGFRFDLLGEGGLYLSVGGSYYLFDADGLEDEWGFYGGLGLQFSKIFLEVMWRDAKGTVEEFSFDGIDLSEDNLELDLSGVNFIIGVRF